MANSFYNAFVQAGLKNEADKLSETIKDKNRNTKRVPALGRYIAVLDSLDRPSLTKKERGLYLKASNAVGDFILKETNFFNEVFSNKPLNKPIIEAFVEETSKGVFKIKK